MAAPLLKAIQEWRARAESRLKLQIERSTAQGWQQVISSISFSLLSDMSLEVINHLPEIGCVLKSVQPTTPTFRDASTDQRGDGCALTVGVVAGGDDNTTGVGDADEPECDSSF